MSKKKAFSGWTMSLKDFHGGSIPSDLPLPSAPGVIVRSNSDRQISTTWGSTMGRSDHRSRPKSSGAVRNFDDNVSYLSHPANIGRNFDEDERTPLDGVPAARRSVTTGSTGAPPIREELKLDYVSSVRPSDKQVTNAVSQSPSFNSSSSTMRYTGMSPVGGNSQIPTGNNGQGGTSSHPNAWGMRKEAMGDGELGASSSWSGSDAGSKLAQASAVEKVSSGKWQSKSPFQLLPHLLYARDDDKSSGVGLFTERGDYDATRGSHAERDWNSEDGVQGGDKELPSNERVRHSIYTEEGQTEANIGGSQSQTVVPSESSERPKLKLLPRANPLDTLEKDYKLPVDSGKFETVNDTFGNANTPKQGLAIGESLNRTAERPKLNLKPRSQPLEQSKGNYERDRSTLFGGARPRELVLKERVVDDIAINKLDLGQTPNRTTDPTKVEPTPDHLGPTARHIDRIENLAPEKRIGRYSERKNHSMDAGKLDIQTKNWQNENWKVSRDTVKAKQNQQPEPDAWRKPIEQPKPASPDASGIRHGKVASAVQLAQAFSRPVSDPKTTDQFSVQRGLPGGNQMPFSRLTDNHEPHLVPTGRHHINSFETLFDRFE